MVASSIPSLHPQRHGLSKYDEFLGHKPNVKKISKQEAYEIGNRLYKGTF